MHLTPVVRGAHFWLFTTAIVTTLRCSCGFAISFEETTTSSGVIKDHHASYLITGQAWGDYDSDGLLDLYLTDNLGPNTLYHNQGDGTFTVSPLSLQVSLPNAHSGGATFADYDNDGDQDLLVVNDGADNLFENTGSAFVDVTTSAGLTHTGEGESVAWADINLDGFLDAYIANWYFADSGHPLTQDRLYFSNGNGSFTDVSYLLDIQRISGPAFAVTFLDYDNDGDQDIYVINDKLFGNLLWRNDGPGCGLWCFTDVSVATGAHRPVCGMGIAVGDYDLDGDDDLYFSSTGEMVLLQSQIAQGNDSYLEVTDTAGVNVDAVGWGSVFVDFDNDGWEDLYLATADSTAGRTNRMYYNTGQTVFSDFSDTSGASTTGASMGVAYADYDNDGRVDLVVGNLNQSYHLYHNITAGGNWLSIKFTGSGPINRDAVGTVAILELSDGRQLRRRVHIGSSIGAGHQLNLHFGLGSANPMSLNVLWPNGAQQTLTDLPSNQFMNIIYAAGPEELFQNGFEN